MTIQITEGLTFDDLLLSPKYSNIHSRSDIDLSISLPKINIKINHPIIPSNMKTIIGYKLAREVLINKGMGILHRFISLEEQISLFHKLEEEFGKSIYDYLGFSIGVKSIDYHNLKELIRCGAKIICVDVAHGDSELCHNMCKTINRDYPHVLLIAGNVATYDGAIRLWTTGVDIIKVGIGNGSLCTTRIETGNGIPQLSALINVFQARKSLSTLKNDLQRNAQDLLIISDGGARNAGDLVKSLCFADLVMTGNIFAGCKETPGEILSIDGKKYKEYVGSSTHKTNHIEGVAALINVKEEFKTILTKLLEGIRSGMSYQNARDLTQLKNHPEFVKITNAGLLESHPHDVILK